MLIFLSRRRMPARAKRPNYQHLRQNLTFLFNPHSPVVRYIQRRGALSGGFGRVIHRILQREVVMTLKNLFPMVALTAFFLLASHAVGQLHVPGPRFEHRGIESADSTRPAATPGIYDYDAQIFSPVEFPTGDELSPKTGFFFSVDRLYTNISGDGEFGGGAGSNYIWGNRYDGGYMNTEEDGWNVVYEQSEGNQFLNGGDILIANPTLYTTKLASVEVNKVYRQRLRNGCWLEPYIGLRYFNLSDRTLEDFGTGVIGGGVAGNRFRQNVTNDAVGMNIGGRLVRRRGRWRYSHDVALAPTYNQQRFLSSDFTTIGTNIFVNETGASDNAFVPALDYRLEVAYNLTRDFGLRGGASVMYLWDGVARTNNLPTLLNPNSTFGDPTRPNAGLFESRLIAAGFSFGFEYRR